ncbi:MAG: tRNA glutamyl-Q(34) synthetase GluQRS [Mailhella sp.]|nr:tRNA glutamyl-Q(34) synthetase GluQRS [Mailhella sp.]
MDIQTDIAPVGRLAPSPTGLLHLGNAWSFLLAWLGVRSHPGGRGRIILRQEDIDPARSRQEWMDGIERDLAWLGLDWDEGPNGPTVPGGVPTPDFGPCQQSLCYARYEAALEELSARGLVYPCYCTRKELRELAGAPHGAHDGLSDAGAAYPGTCRRLSPEERAQREVQGRRPSLRLLCPDGESGRESFTDLVLGPQSFTLTECGGDFALRRSDGVWAYQLAVVADDIAMGVNQIVRGEDILLSTPRQLLLWRLLGGTAPAFAHIPLLHDAEGERLAKRHKSLSLAQLRDAGCRPEAIVGWLAALAGLNPGGCPTTPRDLACRLRAEGGMPWQNLTRTEKIIVPERVVW